MIVNITIEIYFINSDYIFILKVNLIHVSATCKNAAAEKLKQSIRRFADIHGSPAAIILISGDINFDADLSDLCHRKKIYVILLHKKNTSEALILCANEHYDFMELTESLPCPELQQRYENWYVKIIILTKDFFYLKLLI